MSPDASHERASRLTGIALMCGAVACFALLDTTAKYLNLYMSTLQVVWARYTGAFLFPFIVSNPWTRPGLTRTTRPLLQLVRSVLLFVPFVWTTPSDPLVIALMVATGAIGSFGHYLLIAAHRLAPAAVLSPFIYTEIVLVTALGFLVFGDVPNRFTLAGAAIVVGSGLYLLHRERKVRGITES